MAQNINLKEFRGEAVRAYLQDGLVELLAGITFAWWAGVFFAYVFLDFGATVVCWLPWLFIMVGLPAAKRRFVYPRIGRVEVVSAGAWKMVAVLGGLVVVVLAVADLLGVVVLVAPQDQVPAVLRPILDAIWSNLSAIMGIVLAGVFVLVAFRHGVSRFYLFALVSLTSGVAFAMLESGRWPTTPLRWALYFAVMGIVLMASGVVLFVRFLRDYPLPAEGASYGND